MTDEVMIGALHRARITSEPDLVATIDAASAAPLGYGAVRLFAFNRTEFVLTSALDIDRPMARGSTGPATFSLVASAPSGGGIDFPIHRGGMGWVGSEEFAVGYQRAPVALPASDAGANARPIDK